MTDRFLDWYLNAPTWKVGLAYLVVLAVGSVALYGSVYTVVLLIQRACP